MNLLQVLSLYEGRLGGVRVDTNTVRLILLPRLVHVGFLYLLGFELFLDRCLICLFELRLSGKEGGSVGLEI